MTTTSRRRIRRPKARTRKGAGWAAFWNLCSTLTRAWQQGRSATSTRPRRTPGGTGSTPRAARPRGGFNSPGTGDGRLLVDLERDNPWLDNGPAGEQPHGIGTGEPDRPDATVPLDAATCDSGGSAA